MRTLTSSLGETYVKDLIAILTFHFILVFIFDLEQEPVGELCNDDFHSGLQLKVKKHKYHRHSRTKLIETIVGSPLFAFLVLIFALDHSSIDVRFGAFYCSFLLGSISGFMFASLAKSPGGDIATMSVHRTNESNQ